MRSYLLLVFLLCCGVSTSLFAQEGGESGILKGKLVNAGTGTPANDVQVSIPSLRRLTSTDGNGDFTFSEVPFGSYKMVFGGALVVADTVSVFINQKNADAGTYRVRFNEQSAVAQQAELPPTIALEESDLTSNDEGATSQNVSGLLTASRDPFLNTIAFVFGPYRFQPRGYDRNQQEVMINGAVMNDVETGDAYWAQWGGLNDVFRSRNLTYGLQPSEYAFGGINGTTYFDATAANQRRQTRATYSVSNRSYRNRIVLTHSTGMMKNGWAFSVSASKRWAEEGYVPGTFYDGYSYYLGVSKKLGKGMLNFITFGAPTRRGKAAPTTMEAMDLAGTHYYNPNWGYQNGEVRNAKVANSYQPTGILNYVYTPNDKTVWNTAVAYQFGTTGNSTLDWYNARDPRPDYYRYLPSYATLDGRPDDAAIITTQDRANPDKYLQLDWDRLYQVNYGNRETINNVDGIAGNNITGRRSVYAIGNDVDKIQKGVFNTNLERVLTEHLTVFTGLTFIDQRTESYRELTDLLGGDFFVNLNQFAVQQNVAAGNFTQYDVNHPNRLIKKGDRYNYDYVDHFQKGYDWLQLTGTYNKLDFFVSGYAGFNLFNREGKYRNGLFPDNSLGKSPSETFVIYGAKGGLTYKINGRHYLFVNAGVAADAPTIENTFISPRTRNATLDNPTVQHSQSIEGGYLLRAPKLNVRVTGYATDVKDATEIKRFYNDDPNFQTFVNYVMTNVRQRFIGTELAVQAQVNSSLSVTAVAAVGQAFYTDNPNVSVYRDNDTNQAVTAREVYIKNYYVAAGPQSAYSLGLNYRSKKFWYASINANYFDRNYMDVSPDRRTAEAGDLITPGSPEWHAIFDQQKLPSAFTVDVFGGKSFLLSKYYSKLPHNTYLYLNAGISNLLDNKNVVTGAFEQLRYDFTDNNPGKFPPKYFYGLGRNFFVNISLKF